MFIILYFLDLFMVVFIILKNKIYNFIFLCVFIKDVSNFDDLILFNMYIDFDLLKNNVVISFIGVFVIFFIIFVLVYIFFKCFWKIVYVNRIKKNEI